MEMCYNEALVRPCNYVVMDNEEMTYVDGGVKIDKNKSGYLVTEKCIIQQKLNIFIVESFKL